MTVRRGRPPRGPGAPPRPPARPPPPAPPAPPPPHAPRGRARPGGPDGPLPGDGLAADVVRLAARRRGRAPAARRARRSGGPRVPDQGRPVRQRERHGRRALAVTGHAVLR